MRLRLFWRILTSLFVLAALGAGVLWLMANSAPSWYAPPDPADEQVAELAESVEYQLVERFHKIRPESEPWTVRIREGQINAWLASRMPEWIAHDQSFDWPEGLGTPQVHFSEEGVSLAVAAHLQDTERVLVTRLTPEIVDGRLRFSVDRMGIGNLRLPGHSIDKLIGLINRISSGAALDANAAEGLADILAGEQDFDSHVDLADGRRVEIIDLALSDGVLDLTSRTVMTEEAGD